MVHVQDLHIKARRILAYIFFPFVHCVLFELRNLITTLRYNINPVYLQIIWNGIKKNTVCINDCSHNDLRPVTETNDISDPKRYIILLRYQSGNQVP
jgi:hypothetical protein